MIRSLELRNFVASLNKMSFMAVIAEKSTARTGRRLSCNRAPNRAGADPASTVRAAEVVVVNKRASYISEVCYNSFQRWELGLVKHLVRNARVLR